MRRNLSALAATACLLAVGPTAQALEPAGQLTAAATTAADAMDWSAVKTNGGGWVTGMVTGPTGEVYSRTDVGGAYRWDETAKTWQQMLTATGVQGAVETDYGVESLAVAPSNGKVLYAAVGDSLSTANGRILRSADGGTTWRDGGARFKVHGNGEWRWGGERLSIDPVNPDVVVFGSRTEGVQRSEDGGVTWTRLPAPVGAPVGWQPAGVSFTMFDPASPVVGGKTQGAWIGVQNVGVLRTDDAGRTWRVLHGVSNGVPRDAELSSNGSLFVVVHGYPSQVVRIARTGAVTNVSPSPGGGFAMVAVDPTNPSRVFVGDDGVRDGKLWRSLDGGSTWTALNIALAADDNSRWATTAEIDQWMSGGALAFDPARPGTLWFAEGMGMWRTNDLADSEVTWTFTSDGIEELVSNAAVKPPGKPLVTASWDRGLFRHPTPTVGGASLPHRRSFGSAWDLAASPTDGNFLVAVLNDHQDASGQTYPDRKASASSTDGGATWTRFPALDRGTAPSDMMFGNIAVSAHDSNNIVWVPSNVPMAKAYYTRDRGTSWLPSTMVGAVAGDYLHPAHYLKREILTADATTAGTFYALGGNNSTGIAVLWKTVDGGATFAKVVTSGLSRTGYWDFRYNSHLVSVPGKPGVLFALAGRTDDGTRPYWRSTDGGRTWSQLENLRNAHAMGVGASMTPGGNPTLFTYGTVGSASGLYRSSDLGNSWTQVSGHVRDWYQSITAITGDPEVPGKVYVGFIGGGFSVGSVKTGATPTPSAPPAPAPTAAPAPTTAPTTAPAPAPAPTATPAPTAAPTPAPTAAPTTPAPSPVTCVRGNGRKFSGAELGPSTVCTKKS